VTNYQPPRAPGQAAQRASRTGWVGAASGTGRIAGASPVRPRARARVASASGSATGAGALCAMLVAQLRADATALLVSLDPEAPPAILGPEWITGDFWQATLDLYGDLAIAPGGMDDFVDPGGTYAGVIVAAWLQEGPVNTSPDVHAQEDAMARLYRDEPSCSFAVIAGTWYLP